MSLNFFKADCQYPAISYPEFGLCDPQDGTKAYPDTNNPNSWIAIVKNDKGYDVVFTAIDKCVLTDNEYPNERRCDGMLTTKEHLYLVELKDKRGDWITESKEQLLNTIALMTQTHAKELYKLKKKKAFACNKRHKVFAEIDNGENAKLFRETGFRLDMQAEILLL